MRRAVLATIATLTSLLLPSCRIEGIRLHNETDRVLHRYVVVTSPPPPHRELDPTGAIDPAGSGPIDPDGFNPLFYTPEPTPAGQANGVTVQIDNPPAGSSDPGQILVRVFHHPVEPGKEGSADTMPVKLHEVHAPKASEQVRITVKPHAGTPGGWAIAIDPQQ